MVRAKNITSKHYLHLPICRAYMIRVMEGILIRSTEVLSTMSAGITRADRSWKGSSSKLLREPYGPEPEHFKVSATTKAAALCRRTWTLFTGG